MPVEFIPDYAGIGDVMRSDEVRAALHDTAEQVWARAKSFAGEAKLDAYEASLRVEDGTRPKGRPYSRVVADDASAEAIEWGDTHVVRRRILGRAANTTIF